MANKIVAIGDIHGQYDMLTTLMWKINQCVDLDTTPLVFLGDYVDGGPDTKLVVDALITFQSMYPHWVFLRGNHEQMFLDALTLGQSERQTYYHWYNQGGAATRQSYIGDMVVPDTLGKRLLSEYEKSLVSVVDAIPAEHFAFFNALPYMHESEKFYFVHAGCVPGSPPEDTPDNYKMWIREEFFESDYDWGKRVIAGHTYQKQPLVRPNLAVIDTMWHGEGVITAAVLNDETGEIEQFVTSEDK